jgi:hypothetical protein
VRDQFDASSVLLVDGRSAQRHLPAPDLVLDFGEAEAVRFIRCTAVSERGAALADEC